MLDFKNNPSRPGSIIIAHRGAGHRNSPHRNIRENTLEAFAAAQAEGADAIECDLRRTTDGVIVVHHNRRLTGSNVPISNLTYARLGRLAQKRKFHMPTLEETLQVCRGKISINFELKEGGFEKELLSSIRASFNPGHILITSFKDHFVARIKDLAEDYRTGLLVGLSLARSVGVRRRSLSLKRRMEKCRADFAVVYWRLLTRSFQQSLTEADIPIIAWTVDNPVLAGRLIRRGVAGIITNFPDRMLPLVGRSF